MINNKFLLMLGLCRKAGKTVIGTPMVTNILPQGKIFAVFCSSDASENTQKKIKDKCSFYNVDCYTVSFSGEELGNAVGKSGKVCAFGITDRNFTKELLTLISNEER